VREAVPEIDAPEAALAIATRGAGFGDWAIQGPVGTRAVNGLNAVVDKPPARGSSIVNARTTRGSSAGRAGRGKSGRRARSTAHPGDLPATRRCRSRSVRHAGAWSPSSPAETSPATRQPPWPAEFSTPITALLAR
jgi:hypothetical protein